jgi:hypothetical protein
VKGEKAVILNYNSDIDELLVFMADKYTIKFTELSIVDYQNDNFLMLSGFSQFE